MNKIFLTGRITKDIELKENEKLREELEKKVADIYEEMFLK